MTTKRPDDHVIVIFGATGDLAKRKLLPGLFHLAKSGLLPTGYRVIGSAPAQFALTDDEFRAHAKAACAQFGMAKPNGPAWHEFCGKLHFGAADPDDPKPLVAAVLNAEQEISAEQAQRTVPGAHAPVPVRRIFHLAVPPSAFGSVVTMLGDTKLSKNSRVIIEKPFGYDLASCRKLTETVHSVFAEESIFRIDHFLGKESVENILAFRFANGLFEPIWNRDHISHVQIDVPERIGIEGRAEFFEKTGTFRDMVVTHLFQVLGFVAMEPPITFDAKSLRDEKSKVFHAMRPLDPAKVVRGQYTGYRGEKGVAADSQTETFAALRVDIDNWRWKGVPFYLRSGKSMAQRRQTVTLGLKEPVLRMFPVAARTRQDARSNEVVIDFDDPGWIAVQFMTKQPGPYMRLKEVEMVFKYSDSFHRMHELEGYERLILEAMLGDQSLFTRSDEIDRVWEVATPLLDNPPPVHFYTPGTWGPDQPVKHLIAPHHWHLPDGHQV